MYSIVINTGVLHLGFGAFAFDIKNFTCLFLGKRRSAFSMTWKVSFHWCLPKVGIVFEFVGSMVDLRKAWLQNSVSNSCSYLNCKHEFEKE